VGQEGSVGFYNDALLPHLLDRSIRNGAPHEYRRRVVGAAAGRVLEVGIGSGLNLPFYGPNVTEIIGLEPSRPLIEMASQQARANGCNSVWNPGPISCSA
jgi:hypothetical protein